VEELVAGSDYFLIPRFQRPYSWDRGNIDEFWRDAIEDNELGYFIGPMVGWRHNVNTAELYVVDGQQRLTTLMLLLAAIRNQLRALGQGKLSDGVHRYIEKPDRENNVKFTLQPEVRSPYLDNAILSRDPDATAVPSGRDDEAIAEAYRDLSSRLALTIANVPSQADQIKTLRAMRDKLLGLRLIWIEHGNEDDAYVVFETLNSRGKNLEVVDLLKNHLLSILRRGSNPRADAARDQWTRIRLLIDESQAHIDVNRFILHWWLSQEPYVAQRKLFPAIKLSVRTQSQAGARMAALEADAPLYRAIYEPHYRHWGPEENAIPRALQALSDFGVVQPAPLLLTLLRARRDTAASLRSIVQALETIVRFHFQFTAIAQQSSSGGVSEMYAKYAREVANAADANIAASRLRALCHALAERVPETGAFMSGFTERLMLTDEVNREKKLVQYVLRTMTEHVRPHTKVDGGTVEHILPQAAMPGITAEVVGSIGNLLWVSQDLNEKLASKSFNEKKAILQRYKAQYDVDDVIREATWGAPEILARADRMGRLALDQVWRLPI